jgi:hypothetical protein
MGSRQVEVPDRLVPQYHLRNNGYEFENNLRTNIFPQMRLSVESLALLL